jgi:nuclear protein localization family protein 4
LKLLAESILKLFNSPNFQTFTLVAQEQASSTASNTLPEKDYPGGGAGGSNGEKQMLDDGFEIPPDVGVPPEAFNQQDQGTGGGGGADNAANTVGGNGAAGGGGGGAGGVQICPHCTFENAAGQQDCDICGLPLSG